MPRGKITFSQHKRGRGGAVYKTYKKRFHALIKHLEAMLEQQKALARLQDDYELDKAISKGKEGKVSFIIDLANGYFEGKKWPEKMFHSLSEKLRLCYYDDKKPVKKKEIKNDTTKTSKH